MFVDQSDLDWAYVLLEDIDRARSLTIAIMLRYNEWDSIVNLTVSPSEYPDFMAEEFRYDYQATEIFRKVQDIPLSVDPKEEAVKSFYTAEQLCSATNRRLLPLSHALSGVLHYGQPEWLLGFVRRWRQHVFNVLGSIPMDLEGRFSSGSTYNDRRFILPMDKMISVPTVTSEAFCIVDPFWGRTLWAKDFYDRSNCSNPAFLRGNRFTTVPKTAKTDRGICVEPSLNIYFQLAVGSAIRKALKRKGIDLRYGQDRHRDAVEHGSRSREIATIDLSMASDCLSNELVRLVMPPMWYDLLDSLRSKETKINGVWHRNAKFSSMGNGFTFELETLIFYTLCLTICCDMKVSYKDVSVYGDDIIVPTIVASRVVDALRYFGFTPNKRKTFIDDVPFRESCGADYFNGLLVRGHNIGRIPNEPTEWIKLANGISRMARADLNRFGDRCRYHRAWLRVINHIPTYDRNFGPLHYGDTVIFTDDSNKWTTRCGLGYHELRVTEPTYPAKCYTTYQKGPWRSAIVLAAACGGLLRGRGDTINDTGQSFATPFLKPRSEPNGHKNRWIPLGHFAQARWVADFDSLIGGNPRVGDVNAPYKVNADAYGHMQYIYEAYCNDKSETVLD